MAGADGYFQVNSADLVRHSGEIDAIGDGLTTACRAGDTIRTDISAYGQLCQVVPAFLNGCSRLWSTESPLRPMRRTARPIGSGLSPRTTTLRTAMPRIG
jgi:hypothetical protein